MIRYPAVVVHGLVDAGVAVAPQRPVTLLSARGAALSGGAGWWRALIAAVRADHAPAAMSDILDCADAPARALEALRVGQLRLVLDPACSGFDAVAGAASACGAELLTERPPALDLAEHGAARRLSDWLGGDSGPGVR